MQNYLDLTTLTSQQIEFQIKSYELEFFKTIDKKIESKKYASFCVTFWDLLINFQEVPTQKEMAASFFKHEKIPSKEIDALRARIHRAYPSLVRDLHFGKLCQESGLFDNVLSNVVADMAMGVDLVVCTGQELFAVKLYINTPRANQFLRIKENKGDKYMHIKYIDFPLVSQNRKKCGEFYLYSDTAPKILFEAIKNT